MKARLADTAGLAVFGFRSAGERRRLTDPAARFSCSEAKASGRLLVLDVKVKARPP